MNIKRGATLVALAALLLLATGASALAQSPGPAADVGARPRIQTIRGVVISKQASAFLVETAAGRQLSVQVNALTRFRLPGSADTAFRDLKPGDRIVALGRRTGDTFAARLVRIAMRDRIGRVAGVVTEASAEGITIQTRSGKTAHFLINDKTKILPNGAKVLVGEKVAVAGIRQQTADQLVARLIRVLKDGVTSTSPTPK